MNTMLNVALRVLKFPTIILLSIFVTVDVIAQQSTAMHRPMISAHRGASRVAPENTLLAFTKAIEAGADFIEADVRTTSDGTQVIMHDSSLKRTTGLEKNVQAISINELNKLTVGVDPKNKQKIPTLEDVCVLIEETNRRGGNVKLYVDCKDISPKEVIGILRKHHVLDSAVFYGNVETLAEIKNVYASARVMPSFPGKDQITNVIDRIDPYAFDVSFDGLNAQTVQLCRDKGIKVFSDLLDQHDTPVAYRKAIELGVDLIQTDDVTGVKQVFKEFKWAQN